MISASAVSRVLHAAGFVMAADHQREGMRVRRGLLGVVTVTAQIDTESVALRRAAEAAHVLRDQGYAVEQGGARLKVTKEN